MKGLAAILVELNKPLAVEEISIPAPKLGQVLVKVICSGICGSQIGEIRGVKGHDPYIPHLLGHEGTAVVVECGEGVRHVKPGDHVVMHWRKGAGLESVTPIYDSNRGPIRAGWVTTFNQYAIVSENRITPIPKNFDPALGALFGCAVTTGFGVVNNDAQLRIGESIVVLGAGGIGLNIIQAAVLTTAYPIIAVDLFDHRLELAKSLGATHVINGKSTDVESEVRRILGADADVTVDNTGNVKMIETAYRLAGARGRTVLVGVPAKGQEATIYTLPLHFEKKLTGSHGGNARPAEDIPRLVRLCEAGRLELGSLIAKRYPLRDINNAIDDMTSGAIAGRAIIDME